MWFECTQIRARSFPQIDVVRRVSLLGPAQCARCGDNILLFDRMFNPFLNPDSYDLLLDPDMKDVLAVSELLRPSMLGRCGAIP